MKTINSNHLEYINKELMNMDENTYSHFELYQWHNEYLKNRFSTEDNSEFKWKNRYNTIDQHTSFGRNLIRISNIFWHTESNEEFKIICNLNGIKEEDMNFYIVWNYNTPEYEFPYNWRIKKYDPNCGYIESYTKFNLLTEMFEYISKNNKPMSTYEEFVSSTYDDCSYDK